MLDKYLHGTFAICLLKLLSLIITLLKSVLDGEQSFPTGVQHFSEHLSHHGFMRHTEKIYLRAESKTCY